MLIHDWPLTMSYYPKSLISVVHMQMNINVAHDESINNTVTAEILLALKPKCSLFVFIWRKQESIGL